MDRTISIAVFFVFASLLQGCAMMGFEEERDSLDPVAEVALAIRQGRSPNGALTADASGKVAPTADFEERRERLRVAVSSREVIPGMDMQQVRHVLGEPFDIETAGDSGSGNQRWVYPLGLTGRFGLGSRRMLYFEEGKLVGWENRDAP